MRPRSEERRGAWGLSVCTAIGVVLVVALWWAIHALASIEVSSAVLRVLIAIPSGILGAALFSIFCVSCGAGTVRDPPRLDARLTVAASRPCSSP